MDDSLFDDNVVEKLNPVRQKSKDDEKVDKINIEILSAKVKLSKIKAEIKEASKENSLINERNINSKQEINRLTDEILANEDKTIDKFIQAQRRYNESNVLLSLASFLGGGLILLFMIQLYLNHNLYTKVWHTIYLCAGLFFTIGLYHFSNKLQKLLNNDIAKSYFTERELETDYCVMQIFSEDRVKIHNNIYSVIGFYGFIVSSLIVCYVTFL